LIHHNTFEKREETETLMAAMLSRSTPIARAARAADHWAFLPKKSGRYGQIRTARAGSRDRTRMLYWREIQTSLLFLICPLR
jgi:hypothetical protein